MAQLTLYERRIIADAMARGKVTVLPHRQAVGLSDIEQRFGVGVIDGSRDAWRATRDSNQAAARARLKRERTGSERVSA